MSAKDHFPINPPTPDAHMTIKCESDRTLHIHMPVGPDRPTLRDQFAMAALPGVMAGYGMGFDDAAISRAAYVIADAMMEARK